MGSHDGSTDQTVDGVTVSRQCRHGKAVQAWKVGENGGKPSGQRSAFASLGGILRLHLPSDCQHCGTTCCTHLTLEAHYLGR